jgi:hypothetical protein
VSTQHSAKLTWLALTCSVSIAQTVGPNDAALKAVAETASSICTTVPLEGKDSSGKLSVAANAKLDGFVAKLLSKLADIGFHAGFDYSADSFKNVMHKDLAGAIVQSDQCKQDVLNTLMAQRLKIPASQASQSVGSVNANAPNSTAIGNVNGPVTIGHAAPQNPRE